MWALLLPHPPSTPRGESSRTPRIATGVAGAEAGRPTKTSMPPRSPPLTTPRVHKTLRAGDETPTSAGTRDRVVTESEVPPPRPTSTRSPPGPARVLWVGGPPAVPRCPACPSRLPNGTAGTCRRGEVGGERGTAAAGPRLVPLPLPLLPPLPIPATGAGSAQKRGLCVPTWRGSTRALCSRGDGLPPA